MPSRRTLYWNRNGPAVEPGDSRMGNVGQFMSIRIWDRQSDRAWNPNHLFRMGDDSFLHTRSVCRLLRIETDMEMHPMKCRFALVLAPILLIGQGLFAQTVRPGPLPKPIQPPASFDVIVAGVPKPWGETRDYRFIFDELDAANIQGFMPTFQYQEIPTPQSLGYEVDFITPCKGTDAAFAELASHGVTLIVPGELLYPPPPAEFPSMQDDPLAALIACAGRDQIMAITTYDEPTLWVSQDPDARADYPRLLYDRVKQIDPTIPVLMVHAPLPALVEDAGTPRWITQAEIDVLLADVAWYSQWADAVAFDVYPVPPEIAGIVTPYDIGTLTDYRTGPADYVRWLRNTMPDKLTGIVLQALPYERLAAPGWEGDLAGSPAPTRCELSTMVRTTTAEGASFIIWWGGSFLRAEDADLWNDVLGASQR